MFKYRNKNKQHFLNTHNPRHEGLSPLLLITLENDQDLHIKWLKSFIFTTNNKLGLNLTFELFVTMTTFLHECHQRLSGTLFLF